MRPQNSHPVAIPVQCFAPAAVSMFLTALLGAAVLLGSGPDTATERNWRESPQPTVERAPAAEPVRIADLPADCADSTQLTRSGIRCTD